MTSLISIYDKLIGFLHQGGVILTLIMITTFFLWMLILERQYYFRVSNKKLVDVVLNIWQRRNDKSSWYAHQIRQQQISMIKIYNEKNLATIKLIVVLAPLMGLLGTVTGMIDVFDVMATTGSSNARAMASGVSKATIPTMAGMVVSLSGLLFSVSLQRRSQTSLENLSNHMYTEDHV